MLAGIFLTFEISAKLPWHVSQLCSWWISKTFSNTPANSQEARSPLSQRVFFLAGHFCSVPLRPSWGKQNKTTIFESLKCSLTHLWEESTLFNTGERAPEGKSLSPPWDNCERNRILLVKKRPLATSVSRYFTHFVAVFLHLVFLHLADFSVSFLHHPFF